MSSQPSVVANAPLLNVAAERAAEICANVHLKEDALSLLRPEMSPRQYVEALVENKKYIAAIDFLAHAMPPRVSIWWGCLCLEHVTGGRMEPWERLAFRAAALWVLQPTEENREAAKKPAEVVGLASPAGALAGAANQTGGSVVPPNVPPIPPSPFAPARAVCIAVKTASFKVEGPKIEGTQRSFVDLGLAIAEGRFFPKGIE
jgi:hypothetical protein